MAQKSQTCGSSTITFDDSCTWVCMCSTTRCYWSVACGGKIVTKGQGKPRVRPPQGTVVVQIDGALREIAKGLQEIWGRRVTLADGTPDKRIKRTVKGKRGEIADTLGLRLGPKL